MISIAHAADAAAPAAGAGLFQFVLFIPLIAIFYFLIWRPQSQQAKHHKSLVESISTGDEVVINGGILGKVKKVTDDYLVVEVANNVQLNVQKHALTAALPKGTIKNI